MSVIGSLLMEHSDTSTSSHMMQQLESPQNTRSETDDKVYKITKIALPRIVCGMKMKQAKNYRIVSSVLLLTEAHISQSK